MISMETEFNFKSAICTSREQSERLLSLGLKKETADMHYSTDHRGNVRQLWLLAYGDLHEDVQVHSLPAWSLHRLIEMVAGGSEEQMIFLPDPYDELIEEIAGAIMVGCFPKEYLEE